MTATIAAESAQPRISIGWVISQTFAVVGRRFGGLFLLSFAFIYIPHALAALLPASLSVIRFAAGLPALIFSGAAALITYHELAGPEPMGASESMKLAAGRFGSLWGVGFLSGLAIFAGLLFLVVPAVILTAGWLPAKTIVMVEKQNPSDALSRAWALTQGCRWSLVGLLAIYSCGSIVAAGVPAFLLAFTARAAFASPPQTTEFLQGVFLSPLLFSCAHIVAYVGAAVAYLALRNAKEGPTADIVSVFA